MTAFDNATMHAREQERRKFLNAVSDDMPQHVRNSAIEHLLARAWKAEDTLAAMVREAEKNLQALETALLGEAK